MTASPGYQRVRVPRSPDADTALLADFHALSSIGATPAGGVERQAATAEDGQTHAWLRDWLVQRSFAVLQVHWPGDDPDAPSSLAGAVAAVLYVGGATGDSPSPPRTRYSSTPPTRRPG